METLLSIIIIGRNEEKNLPEVFSSVKKASGKFKKEFHDAPSVLYIDSRSSDNSIEITHEHGIPYLILKGKTSPGIARNLGAQKTSSRFIFFLDGDTLLTENFLVDGVRYLQQHEEAGGVGGILVFRIYTENSLRFQFDNYWNTRKNGEAIYDGVGGTFLYRRTDFINAGQFSTELKASEEFDLLLRITYNGQKLRRIKVPMAIHNDFKSAEESYVKRYLLTKNILLPGKIARNAPRNMSTTYLIIRRYWPQILYLPLLISILLSLLNSLFYLATILFSMLLFLNLFYKRFNIKRAIISVISMIFFSFGWWMGFLFGFNNKSNG